MYKFRFYHPNFIDVDDPPEFSFKTKEELLGHPEIKRVSELDYHERWEICPRVRYEKGPTLMHICRGEKGLECWVKGFIEPEIPKDWFPEWKHENYERDWLNDNSLSLVKGINT